MKEETMKEKKEKNKEVRISCCEREEGMTDLEYYIICIGDDDSDENEIPDDI